LTAGMRHAGRRPPARGAWIGLRAVKPEARAEGMRCVSREAERIPQSTTLRLQEGHDGRRTPAVQRKARRSEPGDPGKCTAVAGRIGLEPIDASIDFCTLIITGRRAVSCLAVRRSS
jgi:hypothetical protein